MARLVNAMVLAFVACVSAIPASQNLVVHEQVKSPPSNFISHGPAESDTVLNLRIALKQSNIVGLEQALFAVSTPGSDQYGKFLTKEDLAEYVKPSIESRAAVNEWLSSNGLSGTSISYAGDWLAVSASVSKVNEMLDADFTVFADNSGTQMIRTLSYSIPTSLVGHIDLIHPTVNFAPISSLKPIPRTSQPTHPTNGATSDLPASCQNETSPQCLQILYNIPTTPATQSTNHLFVSEFEGEWADHTDIKSFLEMFRTDINPNTTFSLLKVHNGTNSKKPEEAGVEAELDLQYTIGLATGVNVTFVTVGPTDISTNKEFYTAVLDEANFLVTMDGPPTVLTTSYGGDEDSVTRALATKICTAYMQLGALGVSVLYSSGDGGVAGNHGASCSGTPFVPVFPATCPYLTSVGATQLGLGNATEFAADFSSGGFSNYFATASYQTAAVATYIEALGTTYAGLYNTSGRGFPDVSANGVNFLIYWDKELGTVSGTSASSPTFASVIALLNDQLIAAGKSPLGFLNPFLYSTGASALTDITIGNNPGCNTTGFNATAGWDPVTGLGTPNFSLLLTAVGL